MYIADLALNSLPIVHLESFYNPILIDTVDLELS